MEELNGFIKTIMIINYIRNVDMKRTRTKML